MKDLRKTAKERVAARDLAALCAEIRAAHPERSWSVQSKVAAPLEQPPDPRIPGALRMYRDGAQSTAIAQYLGITIGAFYPTIARWRARGWWPADATRRSGRPRKRSPEPVEGG